MLSYPSGVDACRCGRGTTGIAGPAWRDRQVSGPFRSLEDSKHAYYLLFDFEMAVAEKFGSTWACSAAAQARFLGPSAFVDSVCLATYRVAAWDGVLGPAATPGIEFPCVV